MKVGILTLPNSDSYGATLQMYALYKTVRDLGYDSEIINYHNHYMKMLRHTTRANSRILGINWLKHKALKLLHCRMHRSFRKFESEKMIKYPQKAFSDKKKLGDIGKRYDAVICGSDQVWNPNITDSDTSYFLDFCGPTTARISYAPSFGVEKLPEIFDVKVKNELKKFSYLSVREETGYRLVYELTHQESRVVLDPTLLVDSTDWTKHEICHHSATGDYILYYTVRGSDSLWQFCTNLARKHNLKILRIGSNFIRKNFEQKDGIEYVCDVSPGEWLYLMHHAKYIMTNSFHGVAFAINYRKNFFVEFSSLTNSRLSHIISMLGLENQIVKSKDSLLPLTVDYTNANRILDQNKSESLTFLKQALSEVDRKNG